MIFETIRGIFDGRQFERRFSVYYFYAKYVARERSWETLYKQIGIVETAARIVETFNRLSSHEQQIFLDEVYKFHNKGRFYDTQINSQGEVSMPKLGYFPTEPKPPPRKAAILYQRDVQRYLLRDALPWDKLDDKTQTMYMKKLYFLTKMYIMEYEKFVRNMAPNDMIEYLVQKTLQWNATKCKKQNFFDHSIYSGAMECEALYTQVSYSLQNGQDNEPELFLADSNSRKELACSKFRYKTNPFSTENVGQRQLGVSTATSENALIERLCDSSNTKRSCNQDSDLQSSTSDDEQEYGYLVRSATEKEKDKQFRRKLRDLHRYRYPLENYYDISNDSCKYKVDKNNWRCKTGEILGEEKQKENKWATARALINSKNDLKGSRVPVRHSRVEKKSVTKSRKPIIRKCKSSTEDKVNHVTETILIASGRPITSTKKPTGLLPCGVENSIVDVNNQCEASDTDESFLSQITTRFIQTAVSGQTSDSCPNVVDKQLILATERTNSTSHQPGFMLVQHSSLNMESA